MQLRCPECGRTWILSDIVKGKEPKSGWCPYCGQYLRIKQTGPAENLALLNEMHEKKKISQV